MTIQFRKYTTVTGVTATTLNAGVSGEKSYLTDLVVTNVGSTATEVAILSSATVVANFYSDATSQICCSFVIPPRTAAGEPLNLKLSAASNVDITASGKRN